MVNLCGVPFCSQNCKYYLDICQRDLYTKRPALNSDTCHKLWSQSITRSTTPQMMSVFLSHSFFLFRSLFSLSLSLFLSPPSVSTAQASTAPLRPARVLRATTARGARRPPPSTRRRRGATAGEEELRTPSPVLPGQGVF